MQRRTRQYEGNGIVVEYEVARCIHAERCVRGLPRVFDSAARPWIQPSHAAADAIAEVIRQCPTGALRYRRTDGGEEEHPAENRVSVVPDGPLYLVGRLRLRTPDGAVAEEQRIALCRCGDSKNKPFCDNSHLEKGFVDSGVVKEHRLQPTTQPADGALSLAPAPNGPILVEGPLQVIGADGSSSAGGKAALCRCGASDSKPYCDGSHARVGFRAD